MSGSLLLNGVSGDAVNRMISAIFVKGDGLKFVMAMVTAPEWRAAIRLSTTSLVLPE